MAEEIDRSWHPNFKNYTEFIASHPNYKGLFFERGSDGNVKWVVAGKSDKGQLRQKWWDEQCRKHNIPIQKGCYAVIARLIHPTKRKVCQCCGKELSILYEYPNKSLLQKINLYFKTDIAQADYTLKEIVTTLCRNSQDLRYIAKLFNAEHVLFFSTDSFATQQGKLVDFIYKNFVDKCTGPLSPGAMSNSPDRFDGYHSDGLCCREKTDKGRHSDNMKTYNQDRRAYEEWADGNYNLANRLMGEFHKGSKLYRCPKCGRMEVMSADHIGPISLGFCHSQYNFTGLCSACNSSKNNRFTKEDVERLIALEKKGIQVISWHSKYIWDELKLQVRNDIDAKKLSSVMVKCHQNVLKLFSIIYQRCGREYLLRFLHPEYSMYDYRFENFDPLDLTKLVVREAPLDSVNKRKNSERYVRIAFETLESFDEKDNRKTSFFHETLSSDINRLILSINNRQYNNADNQIRQVIAKLCDIIKRNEWD